MKEELPPLALPKREYMERAKTLWEALGLPKLRPQSPWFGAPAGDWLPVVGRRREARGRRPLSRQRTHQRGPAARGTQARNPLPAGFEIAGSCTIGRPAPSHQKAATTTNGEAAS